MFNKYRLTSSSGKEIEEEDNAHVICLMYKLKSSSRKNDNSSTGFHRCNEVHERELSKSEQNKGNYRFRFCRTSRYFALTAWVLKKHYNAIVIIMC